MNRILSCFVLVFALIFSVNITFADNGPPIYAGGSSIIGELLWWDNFNGGLSSAWSVNGAGSAENNQIRVANDAFAKIDLRSVLGSDYLNVLGDDFVIQFDAQFSNDRTCFTFSGNNGTGLNGSSGFSFFFRRTGRVDMYNGGDNEIHPQDVSLNLVGEWHNIAVRFNRTANEVSYYQDGKLITTTDLTAFNKNLLDISWTGEFNNGDFNTSPFLGIGPNEQGGLFDNFQIGVYDAAPKFYTPAAGSFTWDSAGWQTRDSVGTWSPSGLPAPTDTAIIRNETQVTGDVTIKSVNIVETGVLTVDSGVKFEVDKLTNIGGRVNVAGELAVADTDMPGDLFLSGKLSPTAASSRISKINVTGPSAELSHAGSVALGTILFENPGDALRKTGAGILEIGNAANGNLILSEGQTVVKDPAALAGTTVEMNGGKLTFGRPGELDFYQFEKNFRDGYYDTILNAGGSMIDSKADGTLGNTATKTLFPEAPPYTGPEPWNSVLHNEQDLGSQYAFVWSGYFTPEISGAYTVWTRADDTTSFWIDLNQDGVFQSGEEIAKSHWNDGGVSGTMTLEAGQTYAVTMLFSEIGGGDIFQFQVSPPGESGHYVFGPNSNGGTWSAPIVDTDFSATDFVVTENSTLELLGNDFQLGKITLAGGKLSLTGNRSDLTVGGLAGSGAISSFNPITLTADSTYDIAIRGATDFDQITVEGMLAMLGGMDVNVTFTADQLPADWEFAIMLFANDGVSGLYTDDTFQNLAAGLLDSLNLHVTGTLLDGANTYLRYADNTLYLGGLGSNESETPEPAAWGLMLLGLGGLYLWRRKKVCSL